MNLPKIDLDNFEDPKFRNSKYVLTSPRSLEACSRLKIPPVDLLHRSRADFQDHFQKLPAHKIDELYLRSEEQRRDKLARARMERQHLIKTYEHLKSKEVVNGYAESAVSPNEKEGRKLQKDINEKKKPIESKRTFNLLRRSTSLSDKSAKLFSKTEAVIKTPSRLDQHFTSLMPKFSPSEVKRLQLAHQRCIQDSSPSFGRNSSLNTGRSQSNMAIFGHSSRPHSALHSDEQGKHIALGHQNLSSPLRRTSSLSLVKDNNFWMRKQMKEKRKSEESEKLKKSYEERQIKLDKLKEQKGKAHSLLSVGAQKDRKIRETQERKEMLEKMIEEYKKELYEAREQSQQRARNRASSRLSEEQHRLAAERKQREIHFHENARKLQMREQEWQNTIRLAQQQKEEHARKVLEEREAKIQKSRNLALAAERLRQEMLRVYNLDSFDKKAQRVALVNEMGLNKA